MSEYLKELIESPDFNNPDYIRGVKETLDAVQYMADDSGLKLAETPAFQEFFDSVFEQWKKLRDT